MTPPFAPSVPLLLVILDSQLEVGNLPCGTAAASSPQSVYVEEGKGDHEGGLLNGFTRDASKSF